MRTLGRYKRNLHLDDNKVISYTTHVATIDSTNRKLYRHGYWSVTTSKHINYVANLYNLTIEDRGQGAEPEKESSELRTIGMVAKFGEILAGPSLKEKNDWKTRMLKAGLENKGLIIPEDWDQLPEEEKERRLNGAIEQLT